MTPATEGRLLITGAGGFVGRTLVATLRARWPSLSLVPLGGETEQIDIRDRLEVEREVREVRPTHVIHLAAISAVTAAYQDPSAAWEVNLHGTLNLLDALSSYVPEARLLHVSTSEVYGFSLNDGPADEDTLLRPANVYALSKAAADLAVQQRAAEGLAAIVARPFNHIGEGQSDRFAVPAFAAQIAAIEFGRQDPVVHVGSLTEERDFLSVDDVVAAYLSILENFEKLEGGSVYNIASGIPRAIGELLARLLSMSERQVAIEVDPNRLRKTPIVRIVGDACKLRRDLGWRPRADLNDVLAAILDRHRALVRGGA